MFKHRHKALTPWKWICSPSTVPTSLSFRLYYSWDLCTGDASWQFSSSFRNKQELDNVKAEKLIHWNSLNIVKVLLESWNLEDSIAGPLSFCRFWRCIILSFLHGKKNICKVYFTKSFLLFFSVCSSSWKNSMLQKWGFTYWMRRKEAQCIGKNI